MLTQRERQELTRAPLRSQLGAAKHSAAATAAGILAVARELLSRSRAKVVVNALLPRGVNVRAKKVRAVPYVSLMPAVSRVNAMVKEIVVGVLATEFPGRVDWVDCGDIFKPQSQQEPAREVDYDRMPDGIHPTPEGSRAWLECLSPHLLPSGGRAAA